MFNIKNICCKLRLHDLALAEYGRHVGQRHVRSLYYCFKMFTHVLTNPEIFGKEVFFNMVVLEIPRIFGNWFYRGLWF